VNNSQERQYVVVQFNPKTRSFLVQSRGLAANTDDSELTSSRTIPMRHSAPMETAVLDRIGRPLAEWDLHVGAELRLFGRTVTLRHCSGETMRWLDYQARRLLRTKIRLEVELSKFCFVSFAQPRHLGVHAPLATHFTKGMAKQDPYVAHQSHRTEVALGGTSNLRALQSEVDYLLERLAGYRPLKAVDMDVDHALTTAAATAVAAKEAAAGAEIGTAAGGIRALEFDSGDGGAAATSIGTLTFRGEAEVGGETGDEVRGAEDEVRGTGDEVRGSGDEVIIVAESNREDASVEIED